MPFPISVPGLSHTRLRGGCRLKFRLWFQPALPSSVGAPGLGARLTEPQCPPHRPEVEVLTVSRTQRAQTCIGSC